MASILDEVAAECARQVTQWGGPEHDDEHGPYAWIAFITKHAGKAMDGDFRGQMIRVAALAVAAVETCDRHRSKKEVG